MVATISGEAQSVEESISTCRFAQRVALVQNEVQGSHESSRSASRQWLLHLVHILPSNWLLILAHSRSW